jgi:urease accessory protein
LRRSAVRWPAVAALPVEQQPVVLGAVVAAAGGTARDASQVALHGHLTAVVTAAPKLFAIDMADAMAVGVALAPLADGLTDEAVHAEAPGWSAPLVERRADDHATWEVRLFAS